MSRKRRLKELNQLKARGGVTEDEYQAQRAEILAGARRLPLSVTASTFPVFRAGCLAVIALAAIILIVAVVLLSRG